MTENVFRKMFDTMVVPDNKGHMSIYVYPKYGIFSFIIYYLACAIARVLGK